MIDFDKEREEIDNRVSEEIEQLLASFQEEHYLSNEEYEKLSFIVDKSYWLGEFRKQAEIDELKAKLEKAQAVPEGFVLVSKNKLLRIIGSASILKPITLNPLMQKYELEVDFIIDTAKLMIEAAQGEEE